MKAGRFALLYPTAGFAGLLFVLGAMWYAASSQNSPAVYLLLFGLTAVLLVSIPHTLLNLADLTIAPESAKPAFAGQEVSLPVEIMNCSRAPRRGIELVLPGRGGVPHRGQHKQQRRKIPGWVNQRKFSCFHGTGTLCSRLSASVRPL